MPMPALVDVNVWFPILLERHEHHRVAMRWWEGLDAGEACWCRAVQQAVLRLLSNETIMGEDVLLPEQAWEAWERLTLDERCAFLPLEPGGIDADWHAHIIGCVATPKLWMDAYLAAWAKGAGLTLATFDKGFRRFPLEKLCLLTP